MFFISLTTIALHVIFYLKNFDYKGVIYIFVAAKVYAHHKLWYKIYFNMKSNDLKNSNEFEKTENSEFENSEQIITDSEIQETVDSISDAPEEITGTDVENTEEIVSEKKKPVKEKVKKQTEKTKKIKEIDLTPDIADETIDLTDEEKTVAETIIETEQPAIEQPVEIEEEKIVTETIIDAEQPVIEEIDLQPVEIKEEETAIPVSVDEQVVETVVEDEQPAIPLKNKVIKAVRVEIDEIIASENEPAQHVLHSEVKKDRIDYSKYTQIELVNALRDLLENEDEADIKYDIEAIKSVFYKQRNEIIEQARLAFIEAGGAEDEFVPEDDPYENDIRELLKKYGLLRREQNKQLDSEKDDNLKRKLEIIERIKGLINNEESINRTFNEFRDLQREWREIGLVPQSKMKNLWDTYHFHVENFYDYIKINRELRDLDLKKNLELKIKLCESAEELLVEPSILRAFNTLQKYHEQWREIGPVPRDNKDDVWERFKHITSIINKKHQDFFESKKSDQKKNYDAKIALCEKVEEIGNSEIVNYRDWDVKSKELVELQKMWRTIGFAPKKDNNKIYERFRTACDTFFTKKREFYSKNKEIQQNNLQQKIDLCVQAEALRDNTDWRKATQDFINIQKKWKEIGPIPRKHSDIIWKRFRAACDFFFDKKSEHFSDVDTEQVDNLKLKEDIIAELENFKPSADVNENLKLLKDIQRRWTEIGHVPFKKKDALQNKFREEISKLFDQLSINEDKRNLLKFKTKMSTFSESTRGQSKMRMEREKYMSKLKQLENDLVLLDNNIGFFAKSKNAEALIEDVKKKIEDTRQSIETLKEKIRVIDEMED